MKYNEVVTALEMKNGRGTSARDNDALMHSMGVRVLWLLLWSQTCD